MFHDSGRLRLDYALFAQKIIPPNPPDPSSPPLPRRGNTLEVTPLQAQGELGTSRATLAGHGRAF